MLEKTQEREFVKRLKRDYNIRALKFKDPARTGAPDRLIILPKGRCLFIEFKRIGETLREDQEGYHEWLRALGHDVIICYTATGALAQVEERILNG